MKKIIGILGIAVVAATMFLNTNAVTNSTEDTSLASLIALNTANAETTWTNCYRTNNFWDRCTGKGTTVLNCVNVVTGGDCGFNSGI